MTRTRTNTFILSLLRVSYTTPSHLERRGGIGMSHWRKYVSGNSYKSHFLAHAHSRSACFSCSLYHTSCEICTAPAALV
ncbi:hypothetical protein BJY52DRAFT_1272361, partial [Lactarius psammicola]